MLLTKKEDVPNLHAVLEKSGKADAPWLFHSYPALSLNRDAQLPLVSLLDTIHVRESSSIARAARWIS